jgi:amidohydrolase
MPVNNRIAAASPEFVEWRRDLHAHPELGFEEHRTSDIVATRLASWGIAVTRGLAGTGVVGTLKVGTSPRAIGIRADMDALAMTEANDFGYASQYAGKMHACGHDGHTAILLAAARHLSETRNFDGTVHFIFQPAEEGGGGGRVMVEEGLFERFPCDFVFGLHNDTAVPLGTMVVAPGPRSAASDRVKITITGRGGHAARPYQTIDPLLIGCHIVLALQSLVSRRTDPQESAVVSITQFHAGSAGNIIPQEAWLNGTVRTLLPEVRDMIEREMQQIVELTAAAHGAVAVLDYERGYPQVINDEDATDRAAAAAAKVVGAENLVRSAPPRMGGEDFSYMAQKVPGCFIRLGQARPGVNNVPVHHPSYDFNDDALPIGASLWAALVEQELPRG